MSSVVFPVFLIEGGDVGIARDSAEFNQNFEEAVSITSRTNLSMRSGNV